MKRRKKLFVVSFHQEEGQKTILLNNHICLFFFSFFFAGDYFEGMKCSRCRKDYFEASDLSCQKCPNPLNKHNRLLRNAIPFALVILLSSIFMMCTIWYLEHVRHGERLKRVFECCSLPKIAVSNLPLTNKFLFASIKNTYLFFSVTRNNSE